jgi:hypothetical protein
MLGRRVNNITSKREGDLTVCTWTVGPFRDVSLGDAIQSNPINAGSNEWRFTIFPKGLTYADAVSLYVTNIDAEMDDGDSLDPKKITTRAVANVRVVFVPNSLPKKEPGKKDEEALAAGGGSVKGSQRGSAAGSSASTGSGGSRSRPGSAAASVTSRSTASGGSGSKKSGSRKSGSGSKASGASAGGGGKAAPGPVEIVKSLSAEFTNLNPSWGFEEFLDMDKVDTTSVVSCLCL